MQPILVIKNVHLVLLETMTHEYVWIVVYLKIQNSTGKTQYITCVYKYVLLAISLIMGLSLVKPHVKLVHSLIIQLGPVYFHVQSTLSPMPPLMQVPMEFVYMSVKLVYLLQKILVLVFLFVQQLPFIIFTLLKRINVSKSVFILILEKKVHRTVSLHVKKDFMVILQQRNAKVVEHNV